MGIWLATHPRKHGELQELALRIGVSVRTLWTWKQEALEKTPVPRKRGRKRRAIEFVRAALRLVVRLWWTMKRGHDGWRSVIAAVIDLGLEFPKDLVQDIVRGLKQKRAAFHRRRAERLCMHTEVLKRDALWSMDETFLGRDAVGEVRGLMLRETFVPRTLWTSVGSPATPEDLVFVLCAAARERGGFPLVLVLDNGGSNCSDAVRALCKLEGVILLFNLPHTPQHNAFGERGIGDVTRACGLDELAARDLDPTQARVCFEKVGAVQTREGLAALLERTSNELDHAPRYDLDGKSPAEIDSLAERADHCVSREDFYRDVCAALQRVAELCLPRRARRLAEREAIIQTLACYALVKRTQGGGCSSRPSNRK